MITEGGDDGDLGLAIRADRDPAQRVDLFLVSLGAFQRVQNAADAFRLILLRIVSMGGKIRLADLLEKGVDILLLGRNRLVQPIDFGTVGLAVEFKGHDTFSSLIVGSFGNEPISQFPL